MIQYILFMSDSVNVCIPVDFLKLLTFYCGIVLKELFNIISRKMMIEIGIELVSCVNDVLKEFFL